MHGQYLNLVIESYVCHVLGIRQLSSSFLVQAFLLSRTEKNFFELLRLVVLILMNCQTFQKSMNSWIRRWFLLTVDCSSFSVLTKTALFSGAQSLFLFCGRARSERQQFSRQYILVNVGDVCVGYSRVRYLGRCQMLMSKTVLNI